MVFGRRLLTRSLEMMLNCYEIDPSPVYKKGDVVYFEEDGGRKLGGLGIVSFLKNGDVWFYWEAYGGDIWRCPQGDPSLKKVLNWTARAVEQHFGTWWLSYDEGQEVFNAQEEP